MFAASQPSGTFEISNVNVANVPSACTSAMGLMKLTG